ncbi:nucleotidyltransferase family protein [Streptomyces boluensis]|uniref:NTP transferase domain-containing protein n=1 Tax=Streptomyces boluensis TaxID=1775135 RepID=A0A964UT13_9ACTN|nr:nucleotidyltransferase family protein [Streptomyces boluensis]NBE54222.1 NTP transferase domain-containing protein [Streptomyces boluensis]
MTPDEGPRIAGLLLAAGGGRRLGGRPKALLPYRGRPLVEHAVQVLRDGGCTEVHVVIGAAAERVRDQAALDGCVLVENPHWEEGMGSSLRAGLDSLAVGGSARATGADRAPQAALVSLVDQPGIGPDAVRRIVGAYTSPASLVCAAYEGRRGHPVLFGAERWAGIAATATGDRGARAYLKAHESEITRVECGDVAEAWDIDTEADLARLL